MNPRESFEAYAAGGFRVEGGGVYLSDENGALYERYQEAVKQVGSVDELVPLLAIRFTGPRDLTYELWIPVLQRIRTLLGDDRDAALSEVMVHLIYGEDDDAEITWRELQNLYPTDLEILRVGLLVGFTWKDEEIVRTCLQGLPPSPENLRIESCLDKTDWEGMRMLVHYDPHRLEWFQRASQAFKARK
ncbi:MAG TPA: hypothetical protein VI643_04030 [Planctomycetota bacterium]|nr:hypothetical protein [Planctomycetota bacterium]